MDIIKHGFLSLLTLLLWIKGLVDGSVVTQTSILWKFMDENATIHCNHTKDAGYNQMYWYRQLPGEAMKLIVFTVANSKPDFEPDFRDERFSATKPDFANGTFTVKNLETKDKGLYFCAVSQPRGQPAYFGQGTKLTVLENNVTAPTVKVLPPSPKECRKQKYEHRRKTLVCVATGFYPDHVSVFWQIDGVNVTNGVATDNTALKEENGNYSITSRLRVSANDWYTPDSNFTCIVSFFNGTETENYQNSIFGKKEVTMTRGKYLKITNNAKLSYGVFIVKSSVYGAFVVFLVWKLQGKHN